MQQLTKSISTVPQRITFTVLAAALVGLGSTAHAAVMEYQLMPGSSYERMRTDTTSYLPVAGASVALGGTIRIDTATGALVSAQFDLGSYSELFDYAPLTPFTNYAVLDYTEETQNISNLNGSVAGTVISFSGANNWLASGNGSAGCSESGGVEGAATCASPSLAAWDGFAIDLLFTPDFSAVMASANWTHNGVTVDNHSLNLFAVRVAEVPVPGAMWLMGSGLAALLAVQRRRVAR
jgi:hypothetical protein